MIQAERVLLETDDEGNLIGLPKLPPNSRLEAIFLLLEDPVTQPTKRTPPLILKGAVTALDASFEPSLSDEDWDASLDRTARQIAGDLKAFT